MKTISNSICINTVEDGTSPSFCDLTNQMGNVACESDGNTISSEQNVSTDVNYFLGSTKQVITQIVCTMDNGQYTLGTTYGSSGANQYYRAVVTNLNTTQPTVTIYVKGGAPLSTPEKVNIQATANSQPMAKDMSINGIKGGAAAVLQELLPSRDSISFARQSDGSLTPASRTLSLQIKYTSGSTTSQQSISESGLTIRWSASVMPSTASTGTAWGSGTSTTGISWSSGDMVVASGVTATNIYIAAFNSGGTLVDMETVPIVKDGDNGDDGKTITVKLTMPTLNIPCDASGNSKASGNKDCYVTMYVDGTAVQTSSMTLTVISKPTSITVQTYADVSQISKNRLYITYSANVARTNLEGTILFSISDGTNTTYSSVDVVCANDGQQGKTGRFFYFADNFDKNNNTDTFSATDTEAPFFRYNNNYWVWVGENFSNKTMKWLYENKGGFPTSLNSNYAIMVTDFKYLITEAIFGSYAHFGSAIINGDWMISQWGTKNGVFSQDYTKFDPAYPNESVNTTHTVNGTTWTGYNFVPNYCVDLLKGVSYQNKAVVRGTIVADNLYHGVCFLSAMGGSKNTVYFCNTAVWDDSHQTELRYSFYEENDWCEGRDWYDEERFTEGEYYTIDEIIELSEGDIQSPVNQGFSECTGYNDVVYVLPNTSNRYPAVVLPDPADVKGKCVDVFGFKYGTGIASFNVGCTRYNKGMTTLVYYNGQNWDVNNETPSYINVGTNQGQRFMSVEVNNVWYWLAVPFFYNP